VRDGTQPLQSAKDYAGDQKKWPQKDRNFFANFQLQMPPIMASFFVTLTCCLSESSKDRPGPSTVPLGVLAGELSEESSAPHANSAQLTIIVTMEPTVPFLKVGISFPGWVLEGVPGIEISFLPC
jgi:hypothetical protein